MESLITRKMNNVRKNISVAIWNSHRRSLLCFLFLSAAACKAPEDNFFMRYKSPDPVELENKIVRLTDDLNQTKDEHDIFSKSIDLSEYLTVSRRENEAIRLLQPYVDNNDFKASDEDMAWLYLNYATANQYVGKADIAETYFQKAIHIVDRGTDEGVAHYIYHHYGRFLVEKKEYELARTYFNRALALRLKLNDQRALSTQKALDTLESIIRRH